MNARVRVFIWLWVSALFVIYLGKHRLPCLFITLKANISREMAKSKTKVRWEKCVIFQKFFHHQKNCMLFCEIENHKSHNWIQKWFYFIWSKNLYRVINKLIVWWTKSTANSSLFHVRKKLQQTDFFYFVRFPNCLTFQSQANC